MRRTRAFKVVMSSGEPVRIDEEEMEKVKESINKGVPVMVKQGLINPKFIVEIILDHQRIEDWVHETHYGFGQGIEASRVGISPLQNLTGVKEQERIEASKFSAELAEKMRIK